MQSAIQERLIALSWVQGSRNPADIFTKSLSKPQAHLDRLGIFEHYPHTVAGASVQFDIDVGRLCALMCRTVEPAVLERLGVELDEVCLSKTRWVVVEFCTSVDSNMRQAAQCVPGVEVICITEEENGLQDETIALVRSAIVRYIEYGVRVLVWSSTLCTGGCLYQNLHRNKPGHDAYLRKVWGVQRKLWKNFGVLVGNIEDEGGTYTQPFFAVEWPKTCQYWSWKATLKFFREWKKTIITTHVDGCAVGMVDQRGTLVYKRWRVDTDYEPLAVVLDRLRCDGTHQHSNDFDLRSTQHYPPDMCLLVLRSLA